MTENINSIGKAMANKARLVNRSIEDWTKSEQGYSLRTNCFYSEFNGMKQLLKAAGVEYDIEYSENPELLEMVAITISGKRFEV